MRKIFKPLIGVIAIGAITLSMNNDQHVFAKEVVGVADSCGYDSASKVNPDYATMNCLLTETALSFDVPPEIVKGIAEGESANWRHFDNNGQAIVTSDNGIGLMQITNQSGYIEESLKNDLVYNIKAGVEILDSMYDRTDLPKINGGDRDDLESWYFAIMAYNGIKPKNSPIVQADGERNKNAYQEKILGYIETYELIDLKELPFKREEFLYDSNSRDNIKFLEMNYEFENLTKSKYAFEKGQKVRATTNASFRSKPTASYENRIDTLTKGEVLTITGRFVYDENATKKNFYVWYPVKRSDGTEGYVASGYLEDYLDPTPAPIPTPTPKPEPKPTPEPPVVIEPDYSYYSKKYADFNSSARDMIWAIDKGLIQGYSNQWYAKTNKYETLLKPNSDLTEYHFLKIFFRYAEKDALVSAKKMSPWKDGVYYLAEKHNLPVLASEKSKTSKARADKGIKRGKLAQLMASYHYGKTVSEKTAIEFFIKNELTVKPTFDEFGRGDNLTRAQVSSFIQRYDEFLSKQK